MRAADLHGVLSGANEFMALFIAAAATIGILFKVWKAQKAAVIKAHEAAQVMDRVALEFQNNHGSSMKDAIDRLEAGQVDQAEQMRRHQEQMTELHTSQVDLIRRIDDAYRLFAHVVTHTPPTEEV